MSSKSSSSIWSIIQHYVLLLTLLFIPVTRRSQFDLYLLSSSSTGSTFNARKTSSFLLWSKRSYPAVLLKINFDWCHLFLSSFRFHIKEWEEPFQKPKGEPFQKPKGEPFQKPKGGNSITGITSGTLINCPTELSTTLKPQCKDNRTTNSKTNYGKN